jgi:VanZ family protein
MQASPAPRPARTRGILQRPKLRQLGFVGAALFSLFIVYGSLFPFAWHDAPGLAPWDALHKILRGDGTKFSRIDFATNVMLSMPVAFCLMAGLRPRWQARDTGLALVALLWCLVLGTVVEVAQSYVPGRVPSRYDILAQGLGAVIGLVVWAWRGEWIWTTAFEWSPFSEGRSGWQQASSLYLLGMFGYGLLPLDLTISPFDLYDKWKAGLIHIVPLHQLAHWDARVAYHLASLLLLWGLAAWLLQKGHGLTMAGTVLRTAACAAVLELLQLFVLSRSTDTTDVLMAIVAASIVGLFARLPAATSAATHASSVTAMHVLFMAAGALLTLALSWYPFVPHADPRAWREALLSWGDLPLGALFATQPLQAGTTVLQKVLLFALWGALAAWASRHRRRGLSGAGLAILCASAVLMLLVEGGKLFLRDKVSSPVNIGFEGLGVWLAYAWTRTVLRPAPELVATAPARPAPPPPTASRLWAVLVIQILLTGVVLAGLGQIDALPYNLRAVLSGRSLLQWACLAVAIPLSVLPWAWLGGRPSRERHRYAWLWLVQPLLLYLLVRLGVPHKQVFNIVGTMSLGWPVELEAALRFAVLNLVLAWGMYSAHRWLDRAETGPRNLARGLGWGFATLLVMGLWHAVVVGQAVTDNLVELMREGGTWFTTPLIFAWWGLLYAAALLLGQVLFGRRRLALVALVPVLGLAAYGMLDQALEPILVKYGKVFSAWQFLLSADRAHYADPMGLLLRYGAAHVVVTLGLVWLLAPLLLSRRAPAASAAAPRRTSRTGNRAMLTSP